MQKISNSTLDMDALGGKTSFENTTVVLDVKRKPIDKETEIKTNGLEIENVANGLDMFTPILELNDPKNGPEAGPRIQVRLQQ